MNHIRPKIRIEDKSDDGLEEEMISNKDHLEEEKKDQNAEGTSSARSNEALPVSATPFLLHITLI
jgi:transposase-like protein